MTTLAGTQKWRPLNPTYGQEVVLQEEGRVASVSSRRCLCPVVLGSRLLHKEGDSFTAKVGRLSGSYSVFSLGVVAANGDLGVRTGMAAVGRDPCSIGIYLEEVILDESGRTPLGHCLVTSNS